MSRNSTGHTQGAISTKPTKHAKPLQSTVPHWPPKQTPEVVAAIYYFGAFKLDGSTISKLVISKYPHAENVGTDDCYNRVVWLNDYLVGNGLLFVKTTVGRAVKEAIPFLKEVNYITHIDDQCEKIIQKYASSLLPDLKDFNNLVRRAIMIEFSAQEHSEYEMWKQRAESISSSKPPPQNNLLRPGPLAYEGGNVFQGYEGPWPSEY